jgi:hypothetical protein
MFRHLLVLAAVHWFAASLPASTMYQYVAVDKAGNSGLIMTGPTSATIQLAVGKTYSVNVYLRETIDGVDTTTSLLAQESGLILGGFGLFRTSGNGTASLSPNPTDFSNGKGAPFDFGGPGSLHGAIDITPANPEGRLTQGFFSTPSTGVAGVTNGLVTEVLLGSITFLNNGTATAYILQPRVPLNVSTKTFASNLGLDDDTPADFQGKGNPEYQGARNLPFQILVTDVPEPSSIIIGIGTLLGGGPLLLRRRRNQYSQQAVART